MSLQRRLLLYLLVCAPIVWSLALGFSVLRARHEVNELFDTEMIRLARQTQLTLAGIDLPPLRDPSLPKSPLNDEGESDVDDLALAVWDSQGRWLLRDREGKELPWLPQASGFSDHQLGSEAWRMYHLQDPIGQRLVAVGHKAFERDELVWGLVGSQMLPWLLVLPVLLLMMAWAVRQAMAPMREVTLALTQRHADDLQRIPLAPAPVELQPMLRAMNGLFDRIEDTLARERRFTADAAHELRTPLSVLTAQWSVYQGAATDDERCAAARAMDAGLNRAARLIDQMLGLSRLDNTQRLPAEQPLDWPAMVEQLFSDVLPLAERRQIELACEWPDPSAGTSGPSWLGDPPLMALLLRNLLDNAVRYAPIGSTVQLRLMPDQLQVDNLAEELRTADLQSWGERFHRPDGQTESGSGLGVSIAQRIAALHGLQLSYHWDEPTQTVSARLSARRASSAEP